jgi:hypothetical protein
MFNQMSSPQLTEAYHAANLLYEHRLNLGIDPVAARIDTLAADIAAELDSRGCPVDTGIPAPVEDNDRWSRTLMAGSWDELAKLAEQRALGANP